MDEIKENTVIIIAGPTAVGKTTLAVALAKIWGTEIISADSRQCYREMKIGVARPSEGDLESVVHHFIASHSVTEELNAGSFEAYALSTLGEIFKKNKVAIMVGGTGLYIKAFCEGIDPMPVISPEIRENVIEGYRQKGLIWLQRELQEKDPQFWIVAEQQNPQRLMRALEILNATGNSILTYRNAQKKERPFQIHKIGWTVPKEKLHANIHDRVDQMMEQGLLEEVKSLIPYRKANALQTVGYKELFDYLDGKMGLEEAVNQIKSNTRQYAKRQMTWFTKDKEFTWLDASKANAQDIVKKISV